MTWWWAVIFYFLLVLVGVVIVGVLLVIVRVLLLLLGVSVTVKLKRWWELCLNKLLVMATKYVFRT